MYVAICIFYKTDYALVKSSVRIDNVTTQSLVPM